MLIFYEKATGNIIGTIDGRIHGEQHMKMWVGDKETIGRLVCNWVKDETGEWIPEKQPELFTEIEKYPPKLKDYRVSSGTLVKK